MVQSFVAIFSGDFPRAVECARQCGEIGRTIGEPIFELQPLITEMNPAAIEVADRLGSPSRSAVARWFAWLSLDVNVRGQSRLPDEGVDLAFASGAPYAIAQSLSFLASRLLRSGDNARGAGELANAVERMLRFRAPTLVWAAIDQSASALAIIDGQQDGAVVLWSALESVGRSSTGQAYMVPGTVKADRAALSSTELEQATLAGSVLTMDSAVAFALERLDKIAAS